jgi:hypothetical protein
MIGVLPNRRDVHAALLLPPPHSETLRARGYVVFHGLLHFHSGKIHAGDCCHKVVALGERAHE